MALSTIAVATLGLVLSLPAMSLVPRDATCDDGDWGPPVQLASGGNNYDSNGVRLAWTGSEYGVAWLEGEFPPVLRFARLDATGNAIGGTTTVIGPPARPVEFDLAWNGSGFAVVWVDARSLVTLYFTALDANGARIGDDLPLTGWPTQSEHPALVWNGAGYGLAWLQYYGGINDNTLRFVRLDPAGVRLAQETVVADALAFNIDVHWTGTGYGLLWWDPVAYGIGFRRLDELGAPAGDVVQVANRYGLPTSAWNGDEYCILWSEDTDQNGSNEVWMELTDADGTLLGAPRRLSVSGYHAGLPSVAWSGGEFGIVWVEFPSAVTTVPTFLRVGASGAPIGEPVSIAAGHAEDRFYGDPRLTWTGAEYGLVLVDHVGPTRDVFLHRVGCHCIDHDLDGWTDCWDCDDTSSDCYSSCSDADGDGYRICDGDCDDGAIDVHPGRAEVCNGIDDNCNGLRDDDGTGEDADRDGVLGVCDDCPLTSDPLQIDGDGDLWGDPCDNCPGVLNPGQEDGDADRVGDVCDNCPVSNADQVDLDRDGQGDVCDLDDGTIYIRFDENSVVAWHPEAAFESWNLYTGDLSVLRTVGIYTLGKSCGLGGLQAAAADPPPGAGMLFLVTGIYSGTATECSLGRDSAGHERPNTLPCP